VDDTADNVTAARELGLAATRFTSAGELRDLPGRLRLLPWNPEGPGASANPA
jgi:hypothetical protein